MYLVPGLADAGRKAPGGRRGPGRAKRPARAGAPAVILAPKNSPVRALPCHPRRGSAARRRCECVCGEFRRRSDRRSLLPLSSCYADVCPLCPWSAAGLRASSAVMATVGVACCARWTLLVLEAASTQRRPNALRASMQGPLAAWRTAQYRPLPRSLDQARTARTSACALTCANRCLCECVEESRVHRSVPLRPASWPTEP